MSRETFSYTHGDTGSEPGSGLDFQTNERPNAQNFDWYWYNVTQAIKGHANEFDRLDSNDDGQVDSADYADNADQLDGNEATAFANSGHNHDGSYILEGGDTMSGVLTLNDGSTAASQSWVNSNADVPNADYADSAGDADTLDGEHASAFADSGHLHDSRYVMESGDTMSGDLDMNGSSLNNIHRMNLSTTNPFYWQTESTTAGTFLSIQFDTGNMSIGKGESSASYPVVLAGETNTQGILRENGDPVLSSSTGTSYDIQKNGTDGAGIINFKT